MTQPENLNGATVFKPTPAEVQRNNENKKRRREHEFLMKEVFDLREIVTRLQKEIEDLKND